MRRQLAAITLLLTLAAPALLSGHEGHEHKRFMGTVTMIDQKHVMLKTKEGKEITIYLDQSTKYRRGSAAATAAGAGVKVGDRVVVSVTSDREPYTAKEVRLGSGTTSSKKLPRR